MRKLFAIVGAVMLVACTAQERQVGADDAARIAAGFAQCAIQHAQDQGASAESVAVMCGVGEIPAAIQLIADEIAASSKKPLVDAGAE